MLGATLLFLTLLHGVVLNYAEGHLYLYHYKSER
jgi:hypothetical protein